MTLPATARGWLPYGPHRTWYRITGSLGAARPALVVVHGGPGSTHDYLLNLADLAGDGWPVVHYDQLGSGGSTHLPDADPGFWTPELFLGELDNLLRGLGIADDYVLLGHSWGGLVAARHAAYRPAGLRGAVIANAPASYVLWRAEMDRLRAQLPPDVEAVLREHEIEGTTGSAAYQDAMLVFYARHVCRLDPWPREYRASFLEMADDPTVYAAMNGPSEFHVIGSLRDWSVVDCLPDIDVPVLLVSGRHDEATPATIQPFYDHIPDVRWEIFEESSHVPHLEEPEAFRAVLRKFLRGLPDGRTPDGLTTGAAR
ncbi:proline iminopeptidase-family hydrolase [Hamadaea tsunoensis]|uniref:proline iminopeptidase-family hydrolase n=1 Tax=Hamadaea tsunoensis TaxID=53368 RepID=UPI00040E99A9|nr:proline iminopeptidase-family hydrolase [Hamadaea tsunoensis]